MSGTIKIHVDDEFWVFDEDVSVRLIKCGIERCLSSKTEENGNRNYHSLHYVLQGEGYISVNKEKFKIVKGDIFLIRKNEDIIYYPDRNNPWSFVWADFVGENLDMVFEKCGLEKDKCFVKPKTSKMGKWFEEMLDAYLERGRRLESSVILVHILARLIEENSHTVSRSVNRIVREALIFINNNYKIDITLGLIAKSVGVSPNYLVNLFSSQVGFTPMKYLMMFRVANACDLLKDNKYNIKQISKMVGYKDPLYFSRCFSLIKGVPPRDYRKKCPNDDPWSFIKTSDIDFDDRKGKYL
ncbi:MAG: AraC family transcriptional regulator [Clostridiales bacterium]|nr:AraC family transcriptional regulator [Clostridiales bacterium]